MDYGVCHTCGERGLVGPFEGGMVYSYHCTAEVVVTSDGKMTVIKRCPDLNRTGEILGKSRKT
jgi:hypothetical protein